MTVLGHPLPTVIAEKTVTVLQRGIASTRWRDLVDVRSLARTYPFTATDLASAAAAVSAHRGVGLGPLSDATVGYGDLAQAKWAAWVRTNQLTDVVRADLDDQVADVVAFIDPVYRGDVPASARWDPSAYAWQV